MAPHHLKILQAACEAWDRAQLARIAVASQGLTFTDAGGTIRAHPAVAVERDSRTLFARLVRELNLDEEEPDAT
jgi:phage terminase small subunit